MALVRKAEATGTQSGKPRQPVLIADSGEVCLSCMLYMLLTSCCRSLLLQVSLLLGSICMFARLSTAYQP